MQGIAEGVICVTFPDAADCSNHCVSTLMWSCKDADAEAGENHAAGFDKFFSDSVLAV